MKKLILKIAHKPWLGKVIGWCITHLSHLLPLKIVAENGCAIVFRHPVPSYDIHLLAMLKAQAADFSAITADQLKHIFSASESAARELSASHIMLWANGGRFQEVRQLHFHIFPSELDREGELTEASFRTVGGLSIRECIRGKSSAINHLTADCSTEALVAAFPALCSQYHMPERGYSVFWDLKKPDRVHIRLG